MRCGILVLSVALLVLTSSCEKESPKTTTAPPPAPVAPANTSTQIFQVNGVVIEVKPAEKTVRIKHEKIPGYMDAMTMAFDVKDTNELTGLSAGDTVAFRMNVMEKDGWVDQITKLNVTVATNTLPTTGPVRIVRDVEPLNVGDALPEYHFTNQLGQAVSTTQFRGQALAITFIFTRCPFPTFCPQMSNNFRDVQDALLKSPTAPTNWHLLTITFDPEFDTPERLNNYAQAYRCDPKHWSLLTGKLIDVTAIAEQFGLLFWREKEGSISHNLRTVVVDAGGRVQKIFTENKWTPGELAEETSKAAAVKE